MVVDEDIIEGLSMASWKSGRKSPHTVKCPFTLIHSVSLNSFKFKLDRYRLRALLKRRRNLEDPTFGTLEGLSRLAGYEGC